MDGGIAGLAAGAVADGGHDPEQLDSGPSNLPRIGVLLKDHPDIGESDSQT